MVDLNRINADGIRRFVSEMETKFDVRFIDSSNWLYRILYFLLQRSQKASKLLQFYSTWARPCCIGKYILIPWEIGSDAEPAKRQILTAVHECEHAVRIRQYPKSTASWYREYFLRDRFRALEEACAKCTAAEVDFWASGSYRSLDLTGYCCSEASIRLAEKAYNQRRQVVIGGPAVATSTVSSAAIAILRGGAS